MSPPVCSWGTGTICKQCSEGDCAASLDSGTTTEDLKLGDDGKPQTRGRPLSHQSETKGCPPAVDQHLALCLQLGTTIYHSALFSRGEWGLCTAIVLLQEAFDSGLKARSDG